MYLSFFNGDLDNGHCNSPLPVEGKDKLGISDGERFYIQTLSKIFHLDRKSISSSNLTTIVVVFPKVLELLRMVLLMKFVFNNGLYPSNKIIVSSIRLKKLGF
jgi:hypothetical protein